MHDKLWYLSRIQIFEALPTEDLLEIDKMAPMTHFNSIPKGTIVQSPEVNREGLFFIKTGKLRIYKFNPDGKQFTAGILGPGNMFGEIDSFSLGTRGLYIETLEETLLCSVLKKHFENFLLERPKLALRFLKEISKKLQETTELLEKLTLGNVKDRILYLLLKLSDQFGIDEQSFKRIDFPLTHQEIANMIGATRESVTSSLNDLVKKEIIRTGRSRIYVDQAKLQENLLRTT